ncbi:HD domain-containing protein [Ginsengibacter hankyongi]|uniref:HD domain-containing protein n=1 Tax=Ginsengibacter hankyongi TaxID=2607284 RepID=A0A5J5IJX8_9BACT|nr:HD domain-containing protein [Ginsengibacter hankyongi]KAA9041306.1 HD domain-containing protein [Ginsengibacter hankyongi]
MDIKWSDEELFIFRKISKAAEELNMPAFVIGGFVRDKILNRPDKDLDIVCVGDGIELAKKTAQQFHPIPAVNVFKTFGTAQIKIYKNSFPASLKINGEDDAFDVEFVGARKESYNYNSRKPEVEQGSLDDDRMRRDFTINTIAVSLNKNDFGTLVDPLEGIADIQKKIIETPLHPDQTFSDDPLRMMRAIRFATQLSFNITPATFEAIKKNAHRITIVSAERITDELNKIILTEKPSIGFDLLYKSGLLQIIFPQMVALAGAEYIDGKGHKDNFYHTLQVLDNIAPHTNDLWLRWAAILHDIAKPVTKKFEEGHGWTFHGHEVVGGRMVPKIFAQLKLPHNEKMKFVRKIVELHLRPISLTKENITDSAIRRLIFDAGDDIEALMTLCKADITSKNKQKVQRFLSNFDMVEKRLKEVEESDNLRNWQPPITGEIIMNEFGLPPSRMVGEIKNAVREAVLDGLIPNEFNAAFAFMEQKAKELGIQKKIKN